MTPDSSLAALLDPDRLRVAGTLVGVEHTTDELVDRTGMGRDDVLRAIGALRQAGLVEATGTAYTLPVTSLRRLAGELATDDPMDPRIGDGMTAEECEVLGRYFRGARLVEVPATRAKRLIVLERLAHEFDVGRRYAEPEVNDVLRAFHADVTTLRRHLVDEGLLDREQGRYWRSGGRLDVADQ